MSQAVSPGFVASALVITLISATAGALAVLLLPTDQPITAPDAQADVVSGPDGRPMIVTQQADAQINFPPELTELGVSIEKLAIDQAGNVWIPALSGGDSGHSLYRYDTANSTVDKFEPPDRPGSALSSAIGISSQGDVVLAYGGAVSVIDPSNGSFDTYELPKESPNYIAFGIAESAHVTDMAIGPGDVAYITRENIAAVTLVDLVSGATSELPIKGASGNAFDVEVMGDDVYVASWVHGEDIFDGTTGGTRIVRLSPGGSQEQLDGSAWAISLRENAVYSLDLEGELRAYNAQSLTGVSETLVPAASIDGRLAVDNTTTNVWISGQEADRIVAWNRASQSLTTFDLPLYEVVGSALICPVGAECKNATMHTAVGALAVAPNGDLWFTDNTMQRVGVIHASE